MMDSEATSAAQWLVFCDDPERGMLHFKLDTNNEVLDHILASGLDPKTRNEFLRWADRAFVGSYFQYTFGYVVKVRRQS